VSITIVYIEKWNEIFKVFFYFVSSHINLFFEV
jgi:hypothetical protein